MPLLPDDIEIPLEFSDRAHEALVNVWWTGVLLKRTARQFLKDAGFSVVEFNLLMALNYAQEDLTQSDLSRRLLVDKSNVTGVVDRLERGGLLVRNPVPGDRRRYHITLTDAGRSRVDEVAPVYHGLVEQTMSGLSNTEHRQLIALTGKLREGLLGCFSEEPA